MAKTQEDSHSELWEASHRELRRDLQQRGGPSTEEV